MVALGFDHCQSRRVSAVDVEIQSAAECRHTVTAVPDDASLERAVVILKALGDTARLRLFRAIRAGERDGVCVCDLPDGGLTQATVSHHLRKLKEAGLVTSQRRGTWVYYRAVDGATDGLADLIA